MKTESDIVVLADWKRNKLISLAIQQQLNMEAWTRLEEITNIIILIHNYPSLFSVRIPPELIQEYNALQNYKQFYSDAGPEIQDLTRKLLSRVGILATMY